MAEKPHDSFAPTVQAAGKGQSVLILTADDTQDLEFFYPYYRLIEEGYAVDVATPKGGEFKGKMGMGLKETRAIKDVSAQPYAMLYIPGGKAPAKLKKDEAALALTQQFVSSGKPVAAICHGAQVLAAAGVIEGRRIAAWPEVEDEVVEAGAEFCNEPTVVDGQFITARWPGDLPSHMTATLAALRKSQPQSQSLGGAPRRAAGA